MQRECSICDCRYFDDDPAEMASHEVRHDSRINGVRAPSDFGVEVWRDDFSRIVLVSLGSPEQRVVAEEVAQLARLDTGYDNAAFHALERSGERNVHFFLFQFADRLVGYARFELVTNARRYTWAQWESRTREPLPMHAPIWSLAGIWVNKSNRRTGIATKLLSECSRWFKIEISEVGWQDPFTSDAREFLRRTYPGSFVLAK